MNLCWKGTICCLISRLSPRKSLLSLKLEAVEAVVRAEEYGSHTGGGAHRPNDEIILPDNQAEDTWIDRTEIPPELTEEPSQEMPVSSSAAGSREQKSSSSKKSKTDKKPDQKPEAEVERGPSEPEQETVIYQMERETARDRLFSLMLAGYGLIGLGAAALLYRHIKRKK